MSGPTRLVGRLRDRDVAAPPDERAHATTVVLIDDRPLIRQCLAQWLERGHPDASVATFHSVDDLDDGAVSAPRPSGDVRLIILNIGATAATEPQVVAALDRLTGRFPDVPLILLSDSQDVGAITEAVRRGVRGYIPTTLESPIAIEALRFVCAGGTFVPASALVGAATADVAPTPPRGGRSDRPSPDGGGGAPRRAEPRPSSELDDLTPREAEVLERLLKGKPNKVIAHELSICDSTVKAHVHHIMRKLRATNRTQVAFLARHLLAEQAG